MREKNRKPIASYIKLPQFTTMNVIDGQAGLIIYASLIFYSLTIDNILNIIVLLILAGVTIATLTGDNGLLQKAQSAKEKSSDAEIEEQIKLAYGEYQVAKYDNTDKTAEKIIEDSLKTKYGESITKAKVKNEKVTVDIKVNNEPKTYIYKANTGEAYKYEDPFDYKEKEKKDIDPGDDISIGTEKFKVFYNKDGVIKANIYYDLVTMNESGVVKQGPSALGKSTRINSAFSTEVYWEKGEDSVDMTDLRNNIQQYITAYEKTLEELGADVIEVRLATYSELSAEGVTDEMLDPGRTGSNYWLESSHSDYRNWLMVKGYNQEFGGHYYLNNNNVHPIIIIHYFK